MQDEVMTREEAIIQLKGLKEHCSEMSTQGEIWLDDVNALDMAIKSLEQESCGDCISRELVINYLISEWNKELKDIIQDIRQFPTVTPQSKTGRWIKISPAGIYECSKCRQNVMTSDICAYKYCHGCGAKMESEGK